MLPLARRGPSLLAPEALGARAGLHPELVLRLSRLGLIEQRGGSAAAPLFSAEDAPLLARAMRLRADLGLNYAGALLACDLLGRIEELEARLRASASATPRRM